MSSMSMYQNYRFLNPTLMCLLTITLVTNCNLTYAQEKSIPRDTFLNGDNNGKLVDQGQLRTYYLHIPKYYSSNRPMPLVLVFHGDGSSGRSISNVTRFNTLAEQKGFIVVYPNGIKQRWGLGSNSQTHIDDVSFVSTLISRLKSQLNINNDRVYATGFSKGAILTQALACKLPHKIAAFASVAGSLPVRLKPNCLPQTPVSMLTINGTGDRDVHYQGDGNTQRGALVSVPEMVNFWRVHDKCNSANKSQILNSNSKVKTTHYLGCSGNSEVLQLAVINGGHFWPGGSSSDASLNRFNAKLRLNASRTIWNFFQRHTL